MSTPVMQPAAVVVRKWGEGRAERPLPGCLRVLVDGQHAGGAERKDGVWVACWHTRLWPWPVIRPDHRACERRGSRGRCHRVRLGTSSWCAQGIPRDVDGPRPAHGRGGEQVRTDSPGCWQR